MAIRRTAEQQISDIKQYGRRMPGRNALITHLTGGENTRKDAIYARCYYCMDLDSGSWRTCDEKLCPLWPYSQFGGRPTTSREPLKGAD